MMGQERIYGSCSLNYMMLLSIRVSGANTELSLIAGSDILTAVTIQSPVL